LTKQLVALTVESGRENISMRSAILLLIGAICSAALVAAPAVAAGTVYKSEMPDGRVIYGEEPQPGASRVTKTTVDVGDTGVSPVAPSDVQSVHERARERTRALDDSLTALRIAETELRAAEMEREAGVEPLPGERLGIVGPGSRLSDAYWERQQMLDERVARAQQRLDEVRREYRAIR
jgi:hypothetical protein